jgi:hypothetical protein
MDIEKLIRLQVEQVIITGYEPEDDYIYPASDKRGRHRRSADAPAKTAAGGRQPSSRRDSKNPHSHTSMIAADGFDFSKPYESNVPAPLPTADKTTEEKGFGHHQKQPRESRRRPLAVLLGGLGRK